MNKESTETATHQDAVLAKLHHVAHPSVPGQPQAWVPFRRTHLSVAKQRMTALGLIWCRRDRLTWQQIEMLEYLTCLVLDNRADKQHTIVTVNLSTGRCDHICRPVVRRARRARAHRTGLRLVSSRLAVVKSVDVFETVTQSSEGGAA